MKTLLKKFIPLDYACLSYIVITTLYMFTNLNKLENVHYHILFRLMVVSIIFLLIYLNEKINHFFIEMLRNLYPLIFLASTYGETDWFNNMWLDYQDEFFANLDFIIFGCQPSIEFSKLFSSPLFAELMFFGYFSYYCIIYIASIWLFFKDKLFFRDFFFIVINSFFLYYFIYILLPVAGPMYYFPEELRHTPDGYIFSHAVKFFQHVGEVPTAAFPSSHVGISIIILTLLYKNKRRTFYFILPFTVILCFSTVYIKAHYLVDVIGGFLSVPIIYSLSKVILKRLKLFTNASI